jgi:hypothetical protein
MVCLPAAMYARRAQPVSLAPVSFFLVARHSPRMRAQGCRIMPKVFS